MALRTVCRIFGMDLKPATLAKVAFIEIALLALIYFALIILRYATTLLDHNLFIELMIILGVGMAFDHYFMTTLLMASHK